MATLRCRRGHAVLDPDVQCECGELPPHAVEGQRECPGCGLTLADDTQQCWECGRSLVIGGGTLVLRFPWGDWSHPGGDVLVGRDLGSPLAGPLAAFLAVSRKHVHIGYTGGVAYVYEESRSRHGTFVDGNRVPPGERVPLAHGSVLRLGAGLTAHVVELGTP